MKAPKCWACDGRHWSTQPCDARPAPKTASNKQPAINGAINRPTVNRKQPKERLTDAINEVARETPAGVASSADLPGVPRGRPTERSVAGTTPNRRSRQDYNAYMKGYMRAYRGRLGS